MTVSTTPIPPTAPVVRARRGGNFLNVLLVLAALVAVGGVAFAVGRSSAPVATAAAGRGNGAFVPGGSFAPRGSGGPGGFGGGGRGFGIRGTVTAVTPTSITLQITGGTTITVTTNGSTTYHQQVAGQSSDVAAGRQVIVQLSGGNPNGGGGAAASPSGGAGTGTAGDITVVAP
ncbi:MAG TPA: hypothetical protein VGC90_10565 [Candidatus Limnocylindrales bacterium]